MQFLLQFCVLSPAFQLALDKVIETIDYQQGELIIAKNKPVAFYAYFKKGFAMKYIQLTKLIVRRFYCPEDLLMPGYAPLGESKPAGTVVALTACTIYILPLDKLKLLCDQFEEARFLLTLFQGRKKAAYAKRTDELAHEDAQTRLDLFRLNHPQELMNILPNRGLLASYLGMDPSMLSKLAWPPLDELKARYHMEN